MSKADGIGGDGPRRASSREPRRQPLGERPCSSTLAPASASPWAISQPRPRPEPVTRAVRPSSRNWSGKVDMGRVIRLLRQPELALYWRMLQLPKVIGHRGAAAYAPENTLASFREARRRGATWVEIDIKLTADGVPIVMHDDSLEAHHGHRPAGGRDAARRAADASVPTFEEAIACFGELGLGCNVEIKPCQGREAETGARGGRDAAALLAGPSAAAVAVELQGRLARRRPRGRAGVRPRPADRRARRRLARAGRGRGGGRRSIPTASKLTAVRAVRDPAGRATRSASTPSTIGDVAGRWSAWACDCVITDAPDVILAALG